MTKAIVLSDTHIPKTYPDLPDEIYRSLEEVDIIFHAGDFEDIAILKKLEKITPVVAVCGNMDSLEIHSKCKESEIVNVENFSVGITHGFGACSETIENVKNMFLDKKLDLIIFGHTHIPYLETINDTIFLNPGSPTDKIFSPYNSFGMVVFKDKIEAEIIKV